MLRHETESEGSHGRPCENAQTDGSLMDTAMLALGVTDIHGVEQGRVIDQADGESENDLRDNQGGEAGEQEDHSETAHERQKRREQERKAVVPIRPMPQKPESCQANKKPDGTE